MQNEIRRLAAVDVTERAGLERLFTVGKNARAGEPAEGRTVDEQRLGNGGRSMNLGLIVAKPLADGGEIGNAVERHDGLHVGGNIQEVAFVEALFAVRSGEHLNEIASGGIADNANVIGIDAVFLGMSAQIANGGLAVLNKPREPHRNSAILGRSHDEAGTGERVAHLSKLFMIGRREAAAREVNDGGLFGLGFGKSRQKYLYLPFQYNDYIFAVICEELGFFGAAAIVMLLSALILRGYWIALHAQDRFSTVLASGLVTLIAVQAVLNLGVVTNLLPSTGIALPFFSYGGTALAVNLGEMGIVLSISRHRGERKILEE